MTNKRALAAVYFAPKVSSAPTEILARTDDTMNTPAVNSFHLFIASVLAALVCSGRIIRCRGNICNEGQDSSSPPPRSLDRQADGDVY
jgi:hypothetical protein